MPILTVPFTSIPAQELGKPIEGLEGVRGYSLYYPGETASTELTIKPTANEQWNIEGLTLQFNINYAFTAFIATRRALEALNQVKINLESQRTTLEAIRTKQKRVVEGGTVAEEIENYQSFAAIQSIDAALEGVAREAVELGLKEAREAAKAPPVTFVARLYARGGELIWAQTIDSFTTLRLSGFTVSTEPALGGTTSVKAEVFQAVNLHEQFDDPIHITERENLRLTITAIGPAAVHFEPPLPYSIEGLALFGPLEVGPIQAVANYSRSIGL